MTLGERYPRLLGLAGYEHLTSIPLDSIRTADPVPPPPPFPGLDPAGGRIAVGFVVPVCYGAGAEYQTLSIARGLDPARFVLRGLAITGGPPATDGAMVERFRSIMPVGFGTRDAHKLAGSVDVLVGWDLGGFPAEVARRPDPPRICLVCHSPPESDWGLQAMRQLDGVDSLVAVSELALGTIPEARRGEARVIWNAVDPSRLVATRGRAEVRASWGLPPDAKVAGFYSRLTEEKRPETALDLAASLPPPWHVVVVGEGPMREPLRAEAEARGLGGRLAFPGRDPAAGDVLRAFDCLVVPSRFESFCLTMAEGVWLGRPIAATEVGLARLARDMPVDGLAVRCLASHIPFDADGPRMAEAVRFAVGEGEDRFAVHYAGRVRERTAEAIRPRLDPVRFDAEWSDHLAGLAEGRPRRGERSPFAGGPGTSTRIPPALRDAVLACSNRGSVLPISLQREGCACGELTECRAGRGRVAGRVTLRDCLACMSA